MKQNREGKCTSNEQIYSEGLGCKLLVVRIRGKESRILRCDCGDASHIEFQKLFKCVTDIKFCENRKNSIDYNSNIMLLSSLALPLTLPQTTPHHTIQKNVTEGIFNSPLQAIQHHIRYYV